MMKRIFVLALLAVLTAGMLCACTDHYITDQQAAEVVFADLGVTMEDASSLHIHEGTYSGKDVFNVYITVDGHSYTYVVACDGGEILKITEGAGHTH